MNAVDRLLRAMGLSPSPEVVAAVTDRVEPHGRRRAEVAAQRDSVARDRERARLERRIAELDDTDR